MTSSFLDSCPRCDGEQSFCFARRQSLVERLILRWTGRSTLRCTHCDYRLHVRLTAADRESLQSRARRTSRRPVAVAAPIEESTAEGALEFSALIEEMQQREQDLKRLQDQPDRGDKKGLAS